MIQDRRIFIKKASLATGALAFGSTIFEACSGPAKQEIVFDFDISLAQWCFNKAIFSGAMDHLDFARRAKEEFDISAVEYVNQFFPDKAKDKAYLDEMKKRADDLGVTSVLIMVDNEGDLAATDPERLTESVEKHYKWVEAAKHLGCHSIRVNARGDGSFEESKAAAVDGLGRLSSFAKDFDINVIVEPHGNFSSRGDWLAEVIKQVDLPNCGTLPDFGNFCPKRDENYECLERYDLYKGTAELMPYAKGVSAKTFEFDNNGSEINFDYKKLFTIIKDSGFRGYVGIEYEGKKHSPEEGIRLTKALLEKTKKELQK